MFNAMISMKVTVVQSTFTNSHKMMCFSCRCLQAQEEGSSFQRHGRCNSLDSARPSVDILTYFWRIHMVNTSCSQLVYLSTLKMGEKQAVSVERQHNIPVPASKERY